MLQDNDYKFVITHSLRGYKDKKTSKIVLSGKGVKAYNENIINPDDKLVKIAFTRERLSVIEFANMAISGYAFCNLFSYDPNRKYRFEYRNFNSFCWPEYRRGANKGAMKIQMKSEDYYEGSQCIFVDIDYTRYNDIKEYISVLPLKPTVVYMSYSDNVFKQDKKQKDNPLYDPVMGIKSRRFRLCFVFDKILYGRNAFEKASTAIHKMIEESTHEPIQDECGKNMTQYFNGSMNPEYYVTGCIYNVDDFSDYFQEEIPESILNHPLVISLDRSIPIQKKPFVISKELISDMERLTYEEFVLNYRHKYRYYYRKDDGEWICGYQIIGEDYFALYYNAKNLKDGDKRRKKLYERMCLRRIMFPEITPNEVLFCAYEDMYRFIDNSNDPITIDNLVSNVRSAFKPSVEELELQYSKSLESLKKRAPKRGIIYDVRGMKTAAERNIRMKDIRWNRYDTLYDTNLSLAENATIIGVCTKTLARYCKSRGIATSNKITDAYVRQIIDPDLSIRRNMAFVKDAYEIGISKKRMGRVLKELRHDIQSNNKLCMTENGLPYIFVLREDRSILQDFYPVCPQADIDAGRMNCQAIEYCQGIIAA